MSAKEHLYGRKRRTLEGSGGTRAALYLRVSTADQKPDLQYDGLRAYATQAGLDVVQDYCDVGGVRPPRRPPSTQRLDGGGQKPRDRLRAGVEIRPLCAQHRSHPLFFRRWLQQLLRQASTANDFFTDD